MLCNLQKASKSNMKQWFVPWISLKGINCWRTKDFLLLAVTGAKSAVVLRTLLEFVNYRYSLSFTVCQISVLKTSGTFAI